jgi:hypothetical protein
MVIKGSFFLYLFLFGIGLFVSIAYVADILIDPLFTVPSMTLIALMVIIGWVRVAGVSFIPRIMMLLYIMPFMHTWNYLFNIDYLFSPYYILSHAYQLDPEIYIRMCMVGLIGTIGLILGFGLSTCFRMKDINKSKVDNRRLSLIPFTLFAVISYFLSYGSHPSEVGILDTTHVIASSGLAVLSRTVSFHGAFTFSYCIIAVLALDMIGDYPSRRRSKLCILGFIIFPIIVVHNILNGDRVFVGLVLGLLFLFIYSGLLNSHWTQLVMQMQISMKRLYWTGFILAAMYTVALTLGSWRATAHLGVGFFESLYGLITSGNIYNGTWTAALLTPLSIIGDMIYGDKSLRWGTTYLDYFLSLPPGPVAELLGYTRPFDVGKGLTSDIRFTLGGYHPVVPALLNFSSFGVLIVLTIWGYLFGRSERVAQTGDKWHLLFGACLLITSYGWAWYGTMWIVRGMMGAYAAWWMYKVALTLEWGYFRLNRIKNFTLV